MTPSFASATVRHPPRARPGTESAPTPRATPRPHREPPTLAAWLATLDPLDHHRQVQAFVAWARDAHDPVIVRDLRAGDAWQRGLAVRIVVMLREKIDSFEAYARPCALKDASRQALEVDGAAALAAELQRLRATQ